MTLAVAWTTTERGARDWLATAIEIMCGTASVADNITNDPTTIVWPR